MPPESSNSAAIELGLTNIALAIRAQVNREVDANGWTVYRTGSRVEYSKVFSGTTPSMVAGGGTPYNLFSSGLPVGIGAVPADLHWSAVSTTNGNAAWVRYTMDSSAGSSFIIFAFNMYGGGALSTGYNIKVTITI